MAYIPQVFFILFSCLAVVLAIRYHGGYLPIEDKSTRLTNILSTACFLALFYWGGFFDDWGDSSKQALPQVFVLATSIADCISRLVLGKKQVPVNGIIGITRTAILNYALYCGGFYDVFFQN